MATPDSKVFTLYAAISSEARSDLSARASEIYSALVSIQEIADRIIVNTAEADLAAGIKALAEVAGAKVDAIDRLLGFPGIGGELRTVDAVEEPGYRLVCHPELRT